MPKGTPLFILTKDTQVRSGTGSNLVISDALLAAFQEMNITLARASLRATDYKGRSFAIRDVNNQNRFLIHWNKEFQLWQIFARSPKKTSKSILYKTTRPEKEYLGKLENTLEGYDYNRKEISELKKEGLVAYKEVQQMATDHLMQQLLPESISVSISRRFKLGAEPRFQESLRNLATRQTSRAIGYSPEKI